MAKLRFDDFLLDLDNRLLLRRGAPVALEPKVYECIAVLARRAGQLTTIAQLRHELWPDVSVGPGALRRIINEARRALGDTGEAQAVVRTRKGVGYEFVPTVDTAPELVPTRAVTPTRWPFVGREVELGTLRAAVAELARGRGAMALVIGSAGTGKSALASALIGATSAERWLRAYCPSDASVPPFWVWRRIAGELMDDEASAAELRAFAEREPALSRLVPEFAAQGPPSSLAHTDSEQRFLACDAYLRLLLRVASSQPLAILIEDVHFADDATLLLLSMLASGAASRPLFLCVTLRPEALAQRAALSGWVARSRGREGVVTCELQGLSLAELETLLAALSYRSTTRGAEALHALTGGHPLYVREYVTRALTGKTTSRDELAASLLHVVQDRADSLPGATRRLLGPAAVLGQRFSSAMLARASERTVPSVLEDLAPALACQFLTWSGEGPRELAFAHVLLRDALYAALPLRERQRHHLAAVRVWEEAQPSSERTAELAVHAYAAGEAIDKQQRAEYCERAGREAFDELAFDQAAAHLGRALELWADARASERKAALALSYAAARWHANDPEDAVTEAFVEAARQAERAGHVRLFAEAAIGCAVGDEAIGAVRGVIWKPEAFELLHAAWRLLDAEDGKDAALLRHRVARSLCWLYTNSGQASEAAEFTRLALRHAPSRPDTWTAVLIHGLRCADALWSADAARARDELGATCDDPERPELSVRQGIDAGIQALVMCLALGEIEQYRRVRRRIETLSTNLPEPTSFDRVGERFQAYRLLPLATLVTLAVIEGRFEAADEHLSALRERSAGSPRGANREGTLVLLLLQLFEYRGQAALVEPLLDRHAGRHPEDEWFVALCRARIAVAGGQLAAARGHYAVLRNAGFKVLVRGRHIEPRLDARVGLADVCAELGERDDAQVLYSSLFRGVELCASYGPLISLGSNARVLGELALTMGDTQRALAHFETALQVNGRFGHRPELARTRLGLAKTHVRLRHREAARAEIEVACAAAESMGMPSLVARCEALRREMAAL